jgi:hypothetical protein
MADTLAEERETEERDENETADIGGDRGATALGSTFACIFTPARFLVTLGEESPSFDASL